MDMNMYKQLMDQTAPSAALIHKTKSKMKKEKPIMMKRSFSTAAAAVAIVMLFATTAFAAWYLLSPSEVADKLGNQKLSAAFSGENAININASQTADGYIFTLMSIVSGSDISDRFIFHNGQILSDRTYAVVAIQKVDGSPILFDLDAFIAGENVFYISPYLRGFQPWQINAHTLKGGGAEVVVDGVKYQLVETDDISIFADRGIYIGITPGRTPPDGAFILNEATGEITPNPAFGGVNILFDLPLDASHADPVKAQQYLDAFMAEWYGPGDGNEEVIADSTIRVAATGAVR